MPDNTSFSTVGDSSDEASPDSEIQISAAIVRPLIVSLRYMHKILFGDIVCDFY